MPNLPDCINTVAELDEVLSRPSEELVAAMKRLNGDVMILGAGGKIGPTMARTAQRAMQAAGTKKKVYAVDVVDLPALAAEGIGTLKCDMMDLKAVDALPKAENVVFMVGRKFGSTGSEELTWAINVIVPYHVARSFTKSRVVAFSTGCVYPVVHVFSGGATEDQAPDPVGEYAQSCLGRERMFDYFSVHHGERVVQLRLDYAVEMRYGVLWDVATKVQTGQPVDLTTGFLNCIWQGDVCNQVLRSLELAASPATILNVTGPEILAVRDLATRFGKLLDKEPIFKGQENGKGYLANAMKANAIFGNPSVPVGKVVQWVAQWVKSGGACLGKPTHFETQDGKY
jgi:dTDP-4-dehydrorhamnose reductase